MGVKSLLCLICSAWLSRHYRCLNTSRCLTVPKGRGLRILWLADKSGLSNGNKGFPGGSDRKESVCNVEDLGSIPGLGRTTGEGNGYPLQYSCQENSMDKGNLWAILHGVTNSQTTAWLTLHFNGNKHVNLGKGKSMWFSWAQFNLWIHWASTGVTGEGGWLTSTEQVLFNRLWSVSSILKILKVNKYLHKLDPF